MNLKTCLNPIRRKAVWGPKRIASVVLFTFACLAPLPAAAKQHSHQGAKKRPGVQNASVRNYKLDDELDRRTKGRDDRTTTRVIVTLLPGGKLPAEFKRYTHFRNRNNSALAQLLNGADADDNGQLDLINGVVLDLPQSVIKAMASHPSVFRLHYDRPLKTQNYRTAVTVGARTVQQTLGLTGSGIGIAVIDSGITSWHDDLTNLSSKLFPYGNQRVMKFVDFVNGKTLPYDDNGHGSHVAGIIAGNGYDSQGEKTGIAPGASIISLKVLDRQGQGTISNIIAALGWIATNAKTYNIRVVNMSVGAGVYESYWTDPLTLATKKLTDKGITVVAAAGNLGKNAAGALQWGGVTAPGNAPWVLTVGASSTNGTLTRNDDTMASYSSAGPTALDFESKPDLVAPGTGTISLAVPGSTFYIEKAQYLLAGKVGLGSKPYLALSGTSMAAPVVSGTVALMLQVNPNLTPNLIKGILQYTAETYPGYSALRQGAGFLNTLGAVRLAQFYKNPQAGDKMPVQKVWSRQIIWGSHRLLKGVIKPAANAWANNIVWGTAKTLGDMGDNIVWGTAYGGDNIVWGTSDGDNIVWGTATDGDNIVWGTAKDGDNIVWGTDCGGADCDNIVWGTASDGDNIVWGTAKDGDNIVWGTAKDGDNIVWGTDCGGADCDNIVWGTASDGDNIVWGTASDGDNIVWGTSKDGDNIVWGTSANADVTWGSSAADDAPIYPESDAEPLPSLQLEFGDTVPLLPVVTSTVTGILPLGGL
jgi:serine protease AprX